MNSRFRSLVTSSSIEQKYIGFLATIRKAAISVFSSVYTSKIDIHSSTGWQKSSYHLKKIGQNALVRGR
ncbi:MAG: hypothetical protein V7K57_13215 [Nostoc sp.]|uniref:hypothetical protein n=1 Tax=Nostoc sp. TaxID=1180 RepID=UPI002FF57693